MLSFYATLFLSVLPLSLQSACNTPGYVPCPPNGGSSFGDTLPPSLLGGGLGFPSNLQSPAEDGIQGRSIDAYGGSFKARSLIEDGLTKRQNALCCRPAPVQCRILNQGNVPFCYVSTTFITQNQSLPPYFPPLMHIIITFTPLDLTL